ncbi:MAG TPA: hypothetical protein IAB26_04835 [Candidatus Limivivens merdigallinarum]|uniref:Uncharacterized protein n=1 Tax=Candidatus Limivivens merdigallinarum TaxID=2840859 RepID=A0A9D1D080_9FIRM|nr:hypothetical protein [Candidatus Limivivens merdigallinarum]
MNRFAEKRFHPLKKHTALYSVLLLLLLTLLFLISIRSISDTTHEEQAESLKAAILRSSVHCYAVEGAYPESLSYLEEHYGITYDKENYVVDYEIIGSNILPDVTVIPLT